METRRILRLHHEGKSKRFIAEYLGISRNTVTKYIDFYTISGLSYDEVNTMPNDQLDKLFSPQAVNIPERLVDLQKLFPVLDQRLKRPGMTKKKLWTEYRTNHPDGYSITQFCHYYNLWKKTSSPSLHMNHQAGDKMFIDYTGQKMNIVDKKTRERKAVEVFVAILGASQYTYVEASLSQKKEDFIKCCENALYYFGGV